MTQTADGQSPVDLPAAVLGAPAGQLASVSVSAILPSSQLPNADTGQSLRLNASGKHLLLAPVMMSDAQLLFVLRFSPARKGKVPSTGMSLAERAYHANCISKPFPNHI